MISQSNEAFMRLRIFLCIALNNATGCYRKNSDSKLRTTASRESHCEFHSTEEV